MTSEDPVPVPAMIGASDAPCSSPDVDIGLSTPLVSFAAASTACAAEVPFATRYPALK